MTENEWPDIAGLPEWMLRIMQQMRLVRIETVDISDEWKDRL